MLQLGSGERDGGGVQELLLRKLLWPVEADFEAISSTAAQLLVVQGKIEGVMPGWSTLELSKVVVIV